MVQYIRRELTVIRDGIDMTDDVIAGDVIHGVNERWGRTLPYTHIYLTTKQALPIKKGDVCHFRVIDTPENTFEADMKCTWAGIDLSYDRPRYAFKVGDLFTDTVLDNTYEIPPPGSE